MNMMKCYLASFLNQKCSQLILEELFKDLAMRLTKDMISRFLISLEKLNKQTHQEENAPRLEMEHLSAYLKMIGKQELILCKHVGLKRPRTRDSIRLQKLRALLEHKTKDMYLSPLLRVALLRILLRRMYPRMQKI